MSGVAYEADGAGIRAPLNVVNGVGPATARRIVTERENRGTFRNLSDFLSRMEPPDRILKVLSLAGALDGLDDDWGLTQEAGSAG